MFGTVLMNLGFIWMEQVVGLGCVGFTWMELLGWLGALVAESLVEDFDWTKRTTLMEGTLHPAALVAALGCLIIYYRYIYFGWMTKHLKISLPPLLESTVWIATVIYFGWIPRTCTRGVSFVLDLIFTYRRDSSVSTAYFRDLIKNYAGIELPLRDLL